MDPTVITSAMQWGALGVLMVVLIAVALYLREQAKAVAIREKSNADRLIADQTFMQELVRSAAAQQKDHETSYKQQLEMTIRVQEALLLAMKEVKSELNTHCATTVEMHRELIATLQSRRQGG